MGTIIEVFPFYRALMDSPQAILQARINQILGATGRNTLAIARYPVGDEYEFLPAIDIGYTVGAEVVTPGIAATIDGMGEYQSSRFSPLDRKKQVKCKITMDLWQPEDFNGDQLNTVTDYLVSQGVVIPSVVESMDIDIPMLMDAIKDLPQVQSVPMLPPIQRGKYGADMVLERVILLVVFCPEHCYEGLIV